MTDEEMMTCAEPGRRIANAASFDGRDANRSSVSSDRSIIMLTLASRGTSSGTTLVSGVPAPQAQ